MSVLKVKKQNTSIQATFISHKRSQRRVYPRHALLRLENVKTKEEAKAYIGNCVEYIRMSLEGEKSVYGRINKVHGNSGVVCARFARNLPPNDIGKNVWVKLYKVEEDEI